MKNKQKEVFDKTIKGIKIIATLFAIILKAFFKSITDVVWGVAGIYLLAGLITQYGITAPEGLMIASEIILNRWKYFALAVFVLVLTDNLWRLRNEQ